MSEKVVEKVEKAEKTEPKLGKGYVEKKQKYA